MHLLVYYINLKIFLLSIFLIESNPLITTSVNEAPRV